MFATRDRIVRCDGIIRVRKYAAEELFVCVFRRWLFRGCDPDGAAGGDVSVFWWVVRRVRAAIYGRPFRVQVRKKINFKISIVYIKIIFEVKLFALR